MEFKDFVKGLNREEREVYAAAAGTTVDYLWQISGGFSKPSGLLARRLADESGGKVRREDLRPDIFGESDAA